MKISNILTNNIDTGTEDAFSIIYGMPRQGNAVTFDFGALDIFIFPLIARELFKFTESTDVNLVRNTPLYLLKGGIFAVACMFECTRLATAILLTLAVSPVVAFVCLITTPYYHYLLNKFYHLEGHRVLTTKQDEADATHSITLGEFVSQTASNFNHLSAEPNNKYIHSDAKGNEREETNALFGALTYTSTAYTLFKVAEDNTSAKQNEALEAGRTLGIINS